MLLEVFKLFLGTTAAVVTLLIVVIESRQLPSLSLQRHYVIILHLLSDSGVLEADAVEILLLFYIEGLLLMNIHVIRPILTTALATLSDVIAEYVLVLFVAWRHDGL